MFKIIKIVIVPMLFASIVFLMGCSKIEENNPLEVYEDSNIKEEVLIDNKENENMVNLFSGRWMKDNKDNTHSYIEFRRYEVKYKTCNLEEHKKQFISVINDKECKNIYLGFDGKDDENKEIHIEIVNPTTIKVSNFNDVEVYTKVDDNKPICEEFKTGL